ncbi:MAG: nitronate monooxygenase, partial [Thermomicrobiales bacterium]
GAVPVLAVGGIMDGRGIAAALALGADGVWMGTRFLMASECAAHPLWQERLIAASETDTHLGVVFNEGWENSPLRSLRNEVVLAWEAAGSPPHGSRPGEGDIIGRNGAGQPIPRYHNDGPTLGATGEIGAMCLYAGQGVGLASRVQPAAEIVGELNDELRAAVARVRLAVG